MSHSNARTRRLAALALVVTLPALGGCWPLAPIAGIIAAGGGGGGGGGGDDASGTRLQGTIVTDSTIFDTAIENLDREPNDTLGFAQPIGAMTAAKARRVGGSTGLRATVHVLTESGAS